MFAPLSSTAQPAFEEVVDDENIDAPPGPINNYIYAGIAAAGIIGYVATRQKKVAI